MNEEPRTKAGTPPAAGGRPRVSLQEEYLRKLCNTGREVYVYLVNRMRVRGNIEAFDNYAILLFRSATKKEALPPSTLKERAGRQILLFKSGIVTITPVRLADSIVRTPRVKQLDRKSGLVDDGPDAS